MQICYQFMYIENVTVHVQLYMSFVLCRAAEKSSAHDEYYYLFLKKLCLVLTDLGKQVCALWVCIFCVIKLVTMKQSLALLGSKADT